MFGELGICILLCFPPRQAVPSVVCPPLVTWSAQDQKAAAERLKALPAGDPLRKMGLVVVQQRRYVKACAGQ